MSNDYHTINQDIRVSLTPLVSYTIVLPKNLPPAHKGRAYRFSYDLIVSLTVSLPGQGNRQKSKDIHIPIRVWANVSITNPLCSYDVLKPVIQTKDEARIDSEPSSSTSKLAGQQVPKHRRYSAGERARLRAGDTSESLQTYANHLLETIDLNSETGGRASPKTAPLSPSKVDARSSLLSPAVDPNVDGHSRKSCESGEVSGDKLKISNGNGNGRPNGSKPRQGSFVRGDDELIAEATEEGGCRQAVEVLSRHSVKCTLQMLLTVCRSIEG